MKKAYDRIWRKGLWECLKSYNLGEKFIKVIQQLYNNHKKKIKNHNVSSEWIDSEVGVKQGCILSPLLFTIYINNIQEILQEEKGIEVGNVNIPGLIFADDLVIISETPNTLKKQLQKLQEYLERKKLEINYNKTEILKRGPKTNQEEVWEIWDAKSGTCKGKIKETSCYKYLGIRLGRSRTFTQQKHQVKNNIPRKLGLMKAKAKDTDGEIWSLIMLWKQLTKPTLLYSSEVIPYDEE